MPDEHREHGHHASRGTDEPAPHAAEPLAHHPGPAGEDDRSTIEPQKLGPSHQVLEFTAEEPERDHVEEQVHRRVLVVRLLKTRPVVEKAVSEQRP